MGWAHVVLNYYGPSDGQGFELYVNGTLGVSDGKKSSNTHASGDGEVVVGRLFTDSDGDYSGVDVDELLLFNKTLSQSEMQQLLQHV